MKKGGGVGILLVSLEEKRVIFIGDKPGKEG
jgi:hypothetical protein